MRRSLALAVGASLLAAGPARPARATPPDLYGLGARSPALAMTGVAYADDYEASWLNPAGLGRARRRAIHLGLGAAVPLLSLDGARFAMDSARGMTIGATLPVPLHDVLEDRLVLGLGVYTPQQVLLRGQVFYADVPHWPVLDRAQSIALILGLGVDLHGTDLEGLRIGAGVSALASLIGALDVRLDETSRFASTVQTQLLATFAPIAGLAYQREQWEVGLVYRHEVRSEMSLAIATADLPVMLPVLTIGGLVQYDPAQVAGEVAFRPDPHLRVVANLTARFWSFWPGAQRPTTAGSTLPPAPQFSDTVSPRLAAEGTLRRGPVALTIRAGYALELSPAPPARLGPLRTASGDPLTMGDAVVYGPARYLDNDRHVITAGLGLAYDVDAATRLRLDLFGQLHLLVDRRHLVPARGASMDVDEWMRTAGLVVVGGWVVSLQF